MPNTVIDTTTTPEGTKTACRAHHKIRSMAVSGGFLDGAQLDFADGLNCIIGGRGTGKTTVLEFIRYLLGPMPDTPEGKTRGKAIEGLVRGNLGPGTIGLDVETKHGTRYRAERPWDDASQVLDADGAPVAVSLDRDLVFKADIYSQNEIEEIATTPRFQLSLIDKFEEEAIRETGAEIAKLTRAIEQSAHDLRALDRNIGEIEDVVPEIDIVAKRLQEMQAVEGPEAELINTAHAHKALRARETEALGDLRQVVHRFADEFERLAGAVAEDCATALGDGFAGGPNGAVFVEAADVATEFTSAVRETVPAIGRQRAAAAEALDTLAVGLAGGHARQEQHYRELVARSAEEQAQAAERAKLQQRHLELSKAQGQLDGLKRRRQKCEAEHRKMTARLSELRDERFGLRKEIAERLSAALAPTIRVSIAQAGDRSAYEQYLREAFKGSGTRYGQIVAQIVANLAPEELSPIVRRGDTERLAERTGIGEDQGERIIDHLRDGDHAFRLETVELADEPLIELKDGEAYKNAAGLSTGQRCTVILPILLLESERPLLIDQPEDNLDNAFVYDTIVKSLREAKGGRQLIFVTHNPNIPVLGEAERVFVFASDGRRGSVTRVGPVDEVKGEIEHLLEGGAEAFKLRMRKYGH